MKRLILLIIVGMLAYWVWSRERSMLMRPTDGPGHRNRPHYVQDREAKRHLAKAGHDVRRALQDAKHEIRDAVDKTHDEVTRALDGVRDVFLSNDDDREVATGPPSPLVEREEAEGLPVAIVPGTRVTEAQPVPPAPPRRPIKHRVGLQPRPEPAAVSGIDAEETSTLVGKISATPDRAETQAREDLKHEISTWLDPDVPQSWAIPERLLKSIVLGTELETVVRKDENGPMYKTHLTLDKSPESRARMIGVYNHEVVSRRLVKLGGSLAFILICLAGVSGYIRADEATKGYYTNRLRILAAAGVGAGGVLVYQMVT